MVRLKHANDEKSTTGGREFHTFITLSAKKFLRVVLHMTPCFWERAKWEKIVKTDINHAKNYFVT